MKKLFIVCCLVGLSASVPGALAQSRPQNVQQRRNPQGQNAPRNERRQQPGNQLNRDRALRGDALPERGVRPRAEARQRLQQQVIQTIGLTGDQRRRMENIRRGYDDEIIAAGRRVREARRLLDSAIMSEDYDESLINQRAEALAKAEADRVRLQARMRGHVRSVLTSEQVRRFNQLERRLRRQMREQRQMGMQERNEFAPRAPIEAEDLDIISLILSTP